MKLNYKRTVYVGFAFFLICTFWQAYDTIIPKILTDKYGMNQANSGIIMALDNILALFMLPLFGAISDRHFRKSGRRTPFIMVGTIAAVVLLVALSFVDNMQLKNISDVSAIDDPAALERLYDAEKDEKLLMPNPDPETGKQEFILAEKFPDKTAFTEIKSQVENAETKKMETNKDYTNYVVPARQHYAQRVTHNNPKTLILFIAVLLLLLIAMATFRSPAVALMPDVTIKPLRSKANAIINLMGTLGGALVLVLGIVFSTGAVKNSLMSYTTFFAIVAGIMLVCLLVFRLKVDEPRFVKEMEAESRKYGIDGGEESDGSDSRKLSSAERRSLLLILASVVLWFMGYNAVTSKYSVYATQVLARDYNTTLIIAQVTALIAFIPVGMLASKIGRKKTILIGIVLLAGSFAIASSLRQNSSALLMNILFALAGIGWATINVNSFPMVVELSRGSDVGRYTGFYYTASMAAQTVTPYLSGLLMDKAGNMYPLFPYAAVFVALSAVTMLFVRHGDSKPIPAKTKLEAFDVGD